LGLSLDVLVRVSSALGPTESSNLSNSIGQPHSASAVADQRGLITNTTSITIVHGLGPHEPKPFAAHYCGLAESRTARRRQFAGPISDFKPLCVLSPPVHEEKPTDWID
jgi:hypothetical protein